MSHDSSDKDNERARGDQGSQGVQGIQGVQGATGRQGERGAEGESGRTIEHHHTVIEKEPIHPWRWRLLTLWIIVFSLLNFWAVREGRHNLRQLQANRKEVLMGNCVGQNKRHDETIRRLDDGITKAETNDPARKAQIEQSKRFTILLIDALAPHQNCQAVVAKQLATAPNPK